MAVPSYSAPGIPNIGGQIANLGQNVAVQLNQMTENAERRAAVARDEQYARLAQQRAIVDAENVARTKDQYNQQKVIEAAGGRDLAAQLMSLSYQLKNAGDDPIAKYTVLQQMDQLTGSGINSLTNVQRAMMGGIVSQALEKHPQAKQAYDALNTVRYEQVTLGGQTTTLENLPALVQGNSAALADANRMGNPMLRQMLAQLHPDRFYATGNGTLYSGADAVQGNSLLAQIRTGAKTVDALAAFDRSLETAAVVRQTDAIEAKKLGIDISTATNAMAFNYALKHSKAQEALSSSDKVSSQQRIDILNNMGEYAQVISKQGFRVADLTQQYYTTGADISDLAQQVARVDGVFQQNTDMILSLSGNDINKATRLAELTQVPQKVFNRDGREVVQSVTDQNRVDALSQAWVKPFIEQDNLGALGIQLGYWSQGKQGKQMAVAQQEQLLQSGQISKAIRDKNVTYIGSVDERNSIKVGALLSAPSSGDIGQYVNVISKQRISTATAQDAGRILASVNGRQFDAMTPFLDAAVQRNITYETEAGETQKIPAEVVQDEMGQTALMPKVPKQGDAARMALMGDTDANGALITRQQRTKIPESVNYAQAAADVLGNEGLNTFLTGMFQDVMLAAKDTSEIPTVLEGMVAGLVSERGYTPQQAQAIKTVFYQANAENISSSLLTQRQLFAVQAQEAGAGFSENVPVYENGRFKMETWTLGENGKISRMVGNESAGADFTMEELAGQIRERPAVISAEQTEAGLAAAKSAGANDNEAKSYVGKYAQVTNFDKDIGRYLDAASFAKTQTEFERGLQQDRARSAVDRWFSKSDREYLSIQSAAGWCEDTDRAHMKMASDDIGDAVIRLRERRDDMESDVIARRSDKFKDELANLDKDIDALTEISAVLGNAVDPSVFYSMIQYPAAYVNAAGGAADSKTGSRGLAALQAVGNKYRKSMLYSGLDKLASVDYRSVVVGTPQSKKTSRLPISVDKPVRYYTYDYSQSRQEFFAALRETVLEEPSYNSFGNK